jgi:hypothetical protein
MRFTATEPRRNAKSNTLLLKEINQSFRGDAPSLAPSTNGTALPIAGFILNSKEKQPGATQESESSSVKTVSFNLEQNMQYTNQQVYIDQVCDLWYSDQELKRFRNHTAMAVHILLKSRNAGDVFYDTITHTYAACCQAFKETDRVLTCFQSEQLIQCMGNAKLLGLDKYGVKAVAEHRSERRAVVRKAVLFVQEDTDGNCDIIRAKSESISLTSRLYARSLGVALESDILGKDERYNTTTATLPTASFQSAEALAA